MNSSKDVIIHGILIDDKCYTGALIPPDLDPSDPKATPATSSILALESDPEFAEQCQKATMLAIHGCHEAVETQLREEMTKLPTQFHSLPFHEYIQANISLDPFYLAIASKSNIVDNKYLIRERVRLIYF